MSGTVAPDRRREELLRQLDAARRHGARVELKKSTSNLFRARDRRGVARLDVRQLSHVLEIDARRMTADVEGMTTYDTLVAETLRHGLLPTVTPQLKTITAGGAVSGLGIESSSYRWGLVHENVEEMEVLIGDGRTLRCSAGENADLFRGIANSYGTLGYILRLRLKLMPARRSVRLRHERFSTIAGYFDAAASACREGHADFIDGAVFGRDEMYLTTGEFVDDAPFTSDYTWLRIYYKSIRERETDYLTARDYIWRWDTDWFWCSKQFYAECAAIRLLATRRLLNSRSWQRIMRWSQKLLPYRAGVESVIQDVDVPIAKAPEFLAFLLAEVGITPIWMCPFRTGVAGATYPLYALQPDSLYINFGFWDLISTHREPGYVNRRIERRLLELGGMKALYSTCYYERETFWAICNGTCYRRLKARYDPDNTFPDLYQKCVERR